MRVFAARNRGTLAVLAACVAIPSFVSAGAAASPQHPRSGIVNVPDTAAETRVVLWQDPADLDQRNLFYGPGGIAHQPATRDFTFVDEDLAGSHPKYDVVDADGVRWRVKIGTEARPETAASRVVWAAGYAADEDYFLDEIHVAGMPAHLHRGNHLIEDNGTIRNVRLERRLANRHKIGEWAWRQNPFQGTREFNGLRVLMALINNWDLKDVNNAVFDVGTGDQRRRIFEVSDLGLSFGTTGLERTQRSNGDVRTYRRTRFITHTSDTEVTFEVPRRPDWVVLANAPQFFRRLKLLWIGRHIPRADAKWMGQRLARISTDQFRDAFKAAGYSADDVDGFVSVIEDRIRQLNEL